MDMNCFGCSDVRTEDGEGGAHVPTSQGRLCGGCPGS